MSARVLLAIDEWFVPSWLFVSNSMMRSSEYRHSGCRSFIRTVTWSCDDDLDVWTLNGLSKTRRVCRALKIRRLIYCRRRILVSAVCIVRYYGLLRGIGVPTDLLSSDYECGENEGSCGIHITHAHAWFWVTCQLSRSCDELYMESRVLRTQFERINPFEMR